MIPSALVLLAIGCSPEDGLRPVPAPASVGAAEVPPAPPPASGDPSELPSFENPDLGSVPLFGGTLAAVDALGGVLAADPEGDRLVWIPGAGAPAELALGPNARPFRVEVEGARAWATLRGTGEVVAVDLGEAPTVAWRAEVCPEPRGLDHGPDGALVVACAGGELVALDDATGEVLRWRLLASDLRDVVSADGLLYVSRFRAAEVLLVDPASLETVDLAPLGVHGRVAWRMRADPRGEGVLALYQEASTATVVPSFTGAEYYVSESPCAGRHTSALARVLPEGWATPGVKVKDAVLAVDFLVLEDGELVVANGGGGGTARLEGLLGLGLLADLRDGDCKEGDDRPAGDGLPSGLAEVEGELYLQLAAPASVARATPTAGATAVAWSAGAPALDPLQPVMLFHRDPGSGVACASCHPEGQDDGHVWLFGDGIDGVAVGGPRHTLPLAGHLLDRGPYHWMGELATPYALVRSTFTSGMSGPPVAGWRANALFTWLDGLRPVHRTSVADEATLALGEELFESAGCAGCHAGAALTTNELTTVREFDLPAKTPTLLGLGMRTSYLHDGCASTLLERFVGPEECTGGDRHGLVSTLSDDELTALLVFLESL